MRRLATALLLLAFGGGLAITTARQSTPAGMAGMGGMDSGSGDMDMIGLELRDVDGRRLALPGGMPGAVLFMARRGCPACVGTARTLNRLAADVVPRPNLTLVGTDPVETRADFRAFDRAAGGLDARYALDDRGSSIAGHFRADGAGTVVIYDRSGMVRARLEPGPRQAAEIRDALRDL